MMKVRRAAHEASPSPKAGATRKQGRCSQSPGAGYLQKIELGKRVAVGTLERGAPGRSWSHEEAGAASSGDAIQGSEMGRNTLISPLLPPSRLLPMPSSDLEACSMGG